MQNILSLCLPFVRRWGLILVIATILCAGITPLVTHLMIQPIYEAQTTLTVTVTRIDLAQVQDSRPSIYVPNRLVAAFNWNKSSELPQSGFTVMSTCNQLLKTDQVLQPVAARHGLTTQRLKAMVTTTLQSDAPTIFIVVDDTDPIVAAQLSYEITKSLIDYLATEESWLKLSITNLIIPTHPITPDPWHDSLLGALIGFGLALTIVAIYSCLQMLIVRRRSAM